MLRDPFLPTQVKMNTYLKERKAIPRGRKHRFVLDLFACRQALPLPVKCDGRAWTKAWLPSSSPILCSTGVPSADIVHTMVRNLFQEPYDSDESGSDAEDWFEDLQDLTGNLLADPVTGSALRGEHNAARIYHILSLPLVFIHSRFVVTFSWQLGGRWGGLVGMMDLSQNKPVLACDFGGCANERSLGFLSHANSITLCQGETLRFTSAHAHFVKDFKK